MNGFDVFSCLVNNAQERQHDNVRYENQMADLDKVLKATSMFTFDVEATQWKVSKVLTKNTKFVDEDITYCGLALDGNFIITHLDLSGIKLTDIGLGNLCQSLNSATSLTHLVLSENNIGDEGFSTFSKTLSQNKCLKVLDFRNNNISDRGLEEFGNALNHNHTIEELWLDYNHIADEGAVNLAQTLQEHDCSLRLLSVNDNQISNDGAFQLATVLESGKLKTLRIARNMIVFPDIDHDDEERDTSLEISLFFGCCSK